MSLLRSVALGAIAVAGTVASVRWHQANRRQVQRTRRELERLQELMREQYRLREELMLREELRQLQQQMVGLSQ